MKLVLQVALCCILTTSGGMAQRGGGGGGSRGGGGGGGISRGGGGGGMPGGGGISRGGGSIGRGGGSIGRGGGGGVVVGRGGGGGSINHGGWGGGGGNHYGGSYGNHYGGYYGNRYGGYYGNRYGGYYGNYYGRYYYPYIYAGFGLNYGYWPGYYDSGYYDYGYAYPTYPVYQPSPQVTVVYAPPTTTSTPIYVERARSVSGEYDEYGQRIGPASAPAANTSTSSIYLIAFRDHSIRAAVSYWTEGATLHFVTLEHEQKQAALDTVDRNLSEQLNRERRVAFSLPDRY